MGEEDSAPLTLDDLPGGRVALILLNGVLFLLVAGSVVWVEFWVLDDFLEKTLHGANVDSALALVFFGGLVGAVLNLTGLTYYRRAVLLVVLILGAGLIGCALVLLGIDSATYRTASGTEHLGFLYVVWGVPVAVFLIEAVVVLVVPWDTASAYARHHVRRARSAA